MSGTPFSWQPMSTAPRDGTPILVTNGSWVGLVRFYPRLDWRKGKGWEENWEKGSFETTDPNVIWTETTGCEPALSGGRSRI